MAMALQVNTRLWLKGVLSAHRDAESITVLVQEVKACALCRPLLFCVDGFTGYIGTIQAVLRAPVPAGKAGRQAATVGWHLHRPSDQGGGPARAGGS
jgi:hypothetical protein